MLMLGDEERIRTAIVRLEAEHRELDEKLKNIANLGQLEVQRMKKRKLTLKDEISRMQNSICPDIIA